MPHEPVLEPCCSSLSAETVHERADRWKSRPMEMVDELQSLCDDIRVMIAYFISGEGIAGLVVEERRKAIVQGMRTREITLQLAHTVFVLNQKQQGTPLVCFDRFYPLMNGETVENGVDRLEFDLSAASAFLDVDPAAPSADDVDRIRQFVSDNGIPILTISGRDLKTRIRKAMGRSIRNSTFLRIVSQLKEEAASGITGSTDSDSRDSGST